MASCYERAWGGRTCPGVLIVAGPPFLSEKSSFLAVLAYLSVSHCAPQQRVLLCRQFVHGQTSSDGPRTGARAAPGPQGRSLAGASCKILSLLKEMDVIKREEAKRVASGRGHFRATSEELGLGLH